MTVPSVTDFDNAKLDLITISEVANVDYSGNQTTNRDAVVIDTLTGRLAKLGFIPPVTYAASIVFGAMDNVKTIDRLGIVYAPVPTALPFTTTGTWLGSDDAKFFVVQSSGAITTLQSDVATLQNDVNAIEAELAGELPIRNAVTVGGSNVALTATFSPAITVLTDKLIVAARFSTANLGAALTFQADATAAIQVVKPTGSLSANDITTTQVAILEYNLTENKYYLLNPIQGTASIQPLLTNITKTVGLGGDFATLNLAIEAISKDYYQTYKLSGLSVTLQLVSGFTMSEQIIVKDCDLSFITITSVDLTVTVQRSAMLTDAFSTGYFPVFGANNATLPKIKTRFIINATGSGTNRIGALVIRQSKLIIEGSSSFGFSGGSIGIYAISSDVYCPASTVIGIDIAILSIASTINANNGILQASVGLQAQQNSVCNIEGATFAAGASIPVYVESSVVNANSVVATGALINGLYVDYGGKVSAYLANFRKGGANAPTDILCQRGSIISANNAIGGTTPATKNAATSAGIIFG